MNINLNCWFVWNCWLWIQLTLSHLVIFIICTTRAGIVLVVTPAVCGGVGTFILTVWVFSDPDCVGVGLLWPWLSGCGSSLTLAVWLWVFPDPGCVGGVFPDHGCVCVGLPWLCGCVRQYSAFKTLIWSIISFHAHWMKCQYQRTPLDQQWQI